MKGARFVPRSTDDQTLDLLQRRAAGQPFAQIARETRVASGNVRTRTDRVIEADRDHDPADFEQELYW
jgi:hypothetical protein